MQKLAAVLLCLALAPTVHAEGEDYIAVFVDYLAAPDSSHAPELKDGIGGDVRYGKFAGDEWGYELRAFYGTLKPETSTETGFHGGLAANATYRFGEIWTVRPYLVLGGLFAYADLATGTLNEPSAGVMIDAGGGLWSRPFLEIFGRGISARAEVRAAYEYYQEGYVDTRAYLGLSMPISIKAEPAPEPVKVVEAAAEPAAEPVPEAPAPPAPPTIETAKAGDRIVLHGVNFETARATLTTNAKTILDQVAEKVIARPELQIEVGGHTDSRGSDVYNQDLSERRAQSVMAYLTEKGVDAARLTAVGYGEAQPVDTNETDEGMERNRRVELKVMEGSAADPAATASESEPAAETSTPSENEPAPTE